MASKTYNVAIIGYGMSAKVFHIPLIQVTPAFNLYAIVQRNPTAENDASKDHPGIKLYRSSEDMVQDPDVDVVVINTIPASHFELCRLALEYYKYVIVEKPFTVTSEEADDLINIAVNRDLFLTVYQNRRWDTDFLTLSKLLKAGTLGRVVEFETHFDRHRPETPSGGWKTKPLPGGGGIYDLGTHLIDQVYVLFGLPDRITGFVGSQRERNPEGVDDSCTVLLHYDSGLLATVKAGVVSPEVNQLRYWVRGEKGSYKKASSSPPLALGCSLTLSQFHLDCQEDQLKAGKKPGDAGFGIEPKDRAGTLTFIRDGQLMSEPCPNIEPVTYSAFYSGFAKAIDGQGNVPVPVEAKGAMDVIRLIELARLSSKEGRTLKVKDHYAGTD